MKSRVLLLSAAMELLNLAKRWAEEAGASLAVDAIADAESRVWEARERERKEPKL